jgi:hypothetical protein
MFIDKDKEGEREGGDSISLELGMAHSKPEACGRVLGTQLVGGGGDGDGPGPLCTHPQRNT